MDISAQTELGFADTQLEEQALNGVKKETTTNVWVRTLNTLFHGYSLHSYIIVEDGHKNDFVPGRTIIPRQHMLVDPNQCQKVIDNPHSMPVAAVRDEFGIAELSSEAPFILADPQIVPFK